MSFLVDAARAGAVQSAHDISRGGLAVALAESAIAGARGARVSVSPGRRADEALFGEGGGRVIVSCRPENLDVLRALAARTTLTEIGVVGGDTVSLTVGDLTAEISVAQAHASWDGAIAGMVDE